MKEKIKGIRRFRRMISMIMWFSTCGTAITWYQGDTGDVSNFVLGVAVVSGIMGLWNLRGYIKLRD